MKEEALDPAEDEKRSVPGRLVGEHELPAVAGYPEDPLWRIKCRFPNILGILRGIGGSLDVKDHGFRKVKATKPVQLGPQAQLNVFEIQVITLVEEPDFIEEIAAIECCSSTCSQDLLAAQEPVGPLAETAFVGEP